LAELALNGASLSYEERGQGYPSFLFVHGWASDRSIWAAQMEEFSRDHRCLAVDLRGRGASAPVPPFDMAQAAQDLAGLIETLGLAPVVFVGHSLGGIAGLILNDRYPDLLTGVALLESPINGTTGANSPAAIAAIRNSGSMAAVAAALEGYGYDPPNVLTQGYIERVLMTCPADVAAGQLEKLDAIGRDLARLLKVTDRKPFMIVWAEEPIGDPGWIRDHTTFVRQEPVAESGHFVSLEQPAILNALLRAFLDDISRDPRVKH
jgi:pimeloyl-ACP methyl ester carboxylesterase